MNLYPITEELGTAPLQLPSHDLISPDYMHDTERSAPGHRQTREETLEAPLLLSDSGRKSIVEVLFLVRYSLVYKV